MHFYPAYKREDVLNEYAVTFLALLNEGYRGQFRNYQMLAQISDLPQLEPNARQRIYQELEWAATPPGDILSSSSKGSTDEEITKALGG